MVSEERLAELIEMIDKSEMIAILGKYGGDWVQRCRDTATVLRETQVLRTQMVMLLGSLGGTVEGYPTGSHNYLQRVRELTALEATLLALRPREAALDAALRGMLLVVDSGATLRSASKTVEDARAALGPATAALNAPQEVKPGPVEPIDAARRLMKRIHALASKGSTEFNRYGWTNEQRNKWLGDIAAWTDPDCGGDAAVVTSDKSAVRESIPATAAGALAGGEARDVTRYPLCACNDCPAAAAERHEDPVHGAYGYCKPCERWRDVPHFSNCDHGYALAHPATPPKETP